MPPPDAGPQHQRPRGGLRSASRTRPHCARATGGGSSSSGSWAPRSPPHLSSPHLGLAGSSDTELAAARERFAAAGDEEGLVAVLNALVDRGTLHARWGECLTLADEIAAVAARTGDLASLVAARLDQLGACVKGPLPADEALVRTERLLADPVLQVGEVLRQGPQHQSGRARHARPSGCRQAGAWCGAGATMCELHLSRLTDEMLIGYVYWLLRDLDRAAETFRSGVDVLEAQSEVGWLSTMLPMLGEVLLLQGDVAGARRCAERARDICPPTDIESNSRWRALVARVESLAGRHEEAVQLAIEAVGWERRGDQLDALGDRYLDQATVLAGFAGRPEEAREAVGHAAENYQRKRNRASLRRADKFRARI